MEQIYKDVIISELTKVIETLLEYNGLYYTDEEMVTFSVLDFNIEIDRVNDVICMIKDESYQNGLYD